METRQVLNLLGEPTYAQIINHEVVNMGHNNVAWYTIEVSWGRESQRTYKKQRFRVMQDSLLQVRELSTRLHLGHVTLPMLPISFVNGAAEAIRKQRTKEFNAFLAAVLAVPQLRVSPALVQLLSPDDLMVAGGDRDSTHEAASDNAAASPRAGRPSPAQHATGSRPNEPTWRASAAAISAANLQEGPEGAGPTAGQHALHKDRCSTGDHGRCEGKNDAGRLAARDATGGAGDHGWRGMPSVPAAYPHRTNVDAAVIPAPVLASIQATIERCQAAVEEMQKEIAVRDETIRLKDEAIVQLSHELAALQPGSLE